MDYLTDLTFPSQNSDRFFQKYLSIGLNIVPGCPLVGSCYPVEGIMAFHDDSAVQPGRCFLLVNMCIYTSPVVSVGQVRLVENFRCASAIPWPSRSPILLCCQKMAAMTGTSQISEG